MRALPPTASPAPATSLPLLQLHELMRLFPLWLLLAKRPLLCPWPSPLPMSLCAVVVRLLVARAAWAVAAVSVMERTVVVMGGAASALGGVAAPLLQPLWSLPQPCGVVLGGCMRAPLELLFLVCGRAAVVLQLLPLRQLQCPPPPAPGPGAGGGRAGQRSEGPDAIPGFARGPSRGKRGRSASRGKRGRSAISAHKAFSLLQRPSLARPPNL